MKTDAVSANARMAMNPLRCYAIACPGACVCLHMPPCLRDVRDAHICMHALQQELLKAAICSSGFNLRSGSGP